jgi:hypothetical protein
MENENDVKNNFYDLSELEKLLWSTLEKIRDEYTILSKDQKNIFWITQKIKEYYSEIEDDDNCDVESEWMFDLVWYKNNKNGYLEKTVLVLESELSDRSSKGLLYDFKKLLLSNAELRVMICFGYGNNNSPQNVNEIITLFEESVKAYKNIEIGSRTLVLIWDDYNSGDIYPHLIIK